MRCQEALPIAFRLGHRPDHAEEISGLPFVRRAAGRLMLRDGLRPDCLPQPRKNSPVKIVRETLA